MMKYKLGDKVIYTGPYMGETHLPCEVAHIDTNDEFLPYNVKFADGGTMWANEYELEAGSMIVYLIGVIAMSVLIATGRVYKSDGDDLKYQGKVNEGQSKVFAAEFFFYLPSGLILIAMEVYFFATH